MLDLARARSTINICVAFAHHLQHFRSCVTCDSYIYHIYALLSLLIIYLFHFSLMRVAQLFRETHILNVLLDKQNAHNACDEEVKLGLQDICDHVRGVRMRGEW